MELSNSEIGKRIKELRKQRGYTQEQLAELANISVDFLGIVETGRRSMKIQNLANLAEALNVTTDYIIYGSSPYKENPRINTMISAVPEGKRKQVEKLITLFLASIKANDTDDDIE